MLMLSKNDCENISVDEAAKLLGKKDVVFLDVRTEREYEWARIPNSVLINLYDPNFKNKAMLLDKSKKYVIYCRTGHRSLIACKILKGLNLKVANMCGGILEWIKKGYLVEQGESR